MSLDYAGEMLDRAVYLLAVGVDRVQGRLDDAWAQALSNVPRSDLPEDLRAVFDDIRAQIQSVTPAPSPARRLRPVGSLTDEQAADIARNRIVSGIPLARAIVAKVGQRLSDDELTLTVRDGLMASEFLARYDVADDHQNLEDIGKGVRLIMETARDLMSVHMYQVFSMRLATNAYLKELMGN